MSKHSLYFVVENVKNAAARFDVEHVNLSKGHFGIQLLYDKK